MNTEDFSIGESKDRTSLAIITGAASGLGLQMARELAEHYIPVLVDINEIDLHRAWNECGGGFMHVCDLSNPDEIEELARFIESLDLPVGLLVNNAGITHRSLAEKTSMDVVRKVTAVDYFAPVHLTQSLMPLLKRDQSIITTIGSMAGWMPVMGRAAYCAAKAAVHQYFETLRAETAASGVHILMVYPSFLSTSIEQNALSGDGQRAQHPRSSVGKIQSVSWMSEKIINAIHKRQERVFPDKFTWYASLLYKMAPGMYLRRMEQHFAGELSVS